MLPEKENMSRGSGYKYLFTVFTPTYNRAYTLKRVYDSLQAQTFRDFEWLIVDDGSTDNTAELVQEWQSEAGFPIRYVKKSNGGKHTAINLGVPLAEGELFLIFDSDDACFPDALEKLAHYWNTIDLSERDDFAAVTGWCVDINGNPLCTPFPSDIFDATALDIRRYGAKGEYWGFTRTSVMKQYPFPS
jgi:glycosyltransferase involved in cell wall biosynthesis